MSDLAVSSAHLADGTIGRLSLGRVRGLPVIGLAAAAGFAAASAVTAFLPDTGDWGRTPDFAVILVVLGATCLIASLAAPWLPVVQRQTKARGPWALAIGLIFLAWELASAKFALLPQPFFPPPQAIYEVFTDDFVKLGDSFLASLKLQLTGYAIGAGVGFAIGVAMGSSTMFSYWAHPVLRFVGPMPATAWLPIAFFAFPSSYSASLFLIALATGFPTAVLTWSGIASVSPAYYDVARTLGASPRFLVAKVAIPAALPHVFVGLFMGLGASVAVLVVAELLGVKSGLGWYLQWAQGWAAYANMYAALLVMSLLCSTLITLLFRVRDRLLSWQKGLVKW